MDKEQAKFILQSFRPDGQDAADADFETALQLAVEDRELGEWLTNERAADAEFAAALNEIEIPDQLRLSLLAIMHGESPESSADHEEMDQLVSVALADVQPPTGLRDQILAAMEVEKQAREADVSPKVVRGVFGRKKWINVAAIAAALVLGVFFAMQIDLGSKDSLASHEIQKNAGRLLNSEFVLDVRDGDRTQLTSWLVSNDLPAPVTEGELPPGIRELRTIGCKRISLPDQKEVSLICLITKQDEMVHLIVADNNIVSDLELPTMKEVRESNCYHCPETGWNAVRWRNEKHTFILMSKKRDVQKTELVQFF